MIRKNKEKEEEEVGLIIGLILTRAVYIVVAAIIVAAIVVAAIVVLQIRHTYVIVTPPQTDPT